jgi:hypothetical protein
MITWSYSSIKTFDQCPKKYYHLKVAKDVKDTGSDATIYGQEVHKAAEDYIKFGTPIPAKFKFIEPTVAAFNNIPGEKHTELKLGVKKTDAGYEPCGFFDKDVWWRGIADLLIIDRGRGWLVDYKTSKSAKYADTMQLDLLAGAAFLHFPQLQRIKSALAFVVSNEFIKKSHDATQRDTYINTFNPELERLAGAHESGVWNAVTSPLCGWCPVTSCEHYRRR